MALEPLYEQVTRLLIVLNYFKTKIDISISLPFCYQAWPKYNERQANPGSYNINSSNIIRLYNVQSTPLNQNLVNWEFKKWVGCEHLTPTSQFTLYMQGMYNVNCEVGVKCSQPTHFLNSQLTRFQLSGVDCIIAIPYALSLVFLNSSTGSSSILRCRCGHLTWVCHV